MVDKAQNSMHVLIQKTRTGEYLDRTDTWSHDLGSAKQFASTVDALEFLQDNGMKGVHLLMKLGKPEFDVKLKVQSEQDSIEQ